MRMYFSRLSWKKLWVFALFFFLTAQVLFSVFFLNTWFDEANFGYKSWLYSENIAEPFDDFRAKYGPLGFFSQVLVQDMFGPSLMTARLVSGFFFLLSVYLIFLICRKVSGMRAAMLAVALFAFHPYTVMFNSSAVPYSLIMFLVMLGVYVLTKENTPHLLRIIISSALFTGAFLVRYNVLFVLIGFWIFLYIAWRRLSYVSISIFTSCAVWLVLMIPFFQIDAAYSVAAMLEMFGPIAKLFPVEQFPYFQEIGDFWGSRLNTLLTVLTRYLHVWIIFIGVLFYMTKKKNIFRIFSDGEKESVSKDGILLLSTIIVLLLFCTHFLYWGRSPFEIYSLYFSFFLFMLSALALDSVISYFNEKKTFEAVNSRTQMFFGSSLLLLIMFSVGSFNLISDISNPLRFSDSDLQRIERGALFLRSHASSEDVIFTIDDPHHVFMAGRKEIPQLINKHFTYREELPDTTLERFNLYDFPQLIEWMENTATIVVFQRGSLGARLDLISSDTEDALDQFTEKLSQNFELIGSIEGVYPRKYIVGGGIMDIYKRKNI